MTEKEMTEKVLVSRETLQKLFNGFLFSEESPDYSVSLYKVSGSRKFNKELRGLGFLRYRPLPNPEYVEIAKLKLATKMFFSENIKRKFLIRTILDTGLLKLPVLKKVTLTGFPNKRGQPRITLYLKDEHGKRFECMVKDLHTVLPEGYVYVQNWGAYVHENYESQHTKILVPDEPVVTEMISNVKFGL